MNKAAIAVGLIVSHITCASPINTHAAGDLTKQDPIEVTVQLGNPANELRFFPGKIELETGKLYRVVIKNPSPQKHYFSSEKLSQSVFTRKVQINDAQGNPVAEVKGIVREIEIYPNGTAEWWFVAVTTGTFTDLKCTITGHTEGGMVGEIIIK